jgi:N-acetyl-gamma-glutamyl-phosphate reductase
MIKVAVVGATGYTGAELVRLIQGHPEAELVYISSESSAGEPYSSIHPQFRKRNQMQLEAFKIEKIPASAELAFCALPHGHSAAIVPKLLEIGLRVIDLSADYRLKDPALYENWYALQHPHPSLLSSAVYGLTELYRSDIIDADLIANPGCYPTSVILGLAPLLANRLAHLELIIVDSKSGVSGAGRTPRQPFHFPECTENFKAYRVFSHQHTPEIEQELGRIAGKVIKVAFTPHLVPMIRGIFSTMYVQLNCQLSLDQITALYTDYYRENYFIRIHDQNSLPETRFVRGTNYCDLALRFDRRTGLLVIMSAIDNLVKGASGQAIQNMNISFGLPEEIGLKQLAI